MIKINLKDFKSPPAVLFSLGAIKQIELAVRTTDGDTYTNIYYRDKAVLDRLRAISIHKSTISEKESGKCYYCESKIEHAAKLQVEHFRPKAKITKIDTGQMDNNGYFWLGLEWSNLLLSCPICNRSKGNRFPIRGTRAVAQTPVDQHFCLDRTNCFAHQEPLISEKAILINPEQDDPKDYFGFNLVGEIEPTSSDFERSDASIKIYKLNRPALINERMKLWDQVVKDFDLDIANYEMGAETWNDLSAHCRKICRKLIARTAKEEEFSAWATYLNEQILDFIIADIAEPYQMLFFESYFSELSRHIPRSQS
ncbi:hypothetical protein WG904_12195 [Pedobacter sp. Du54]|uniref:hypothetical protein n=1 Tax=Pedobacter anseongensis TaxID=3133439 RepID=UPI0030B5E9F0